MNIFGSYQKVNVFVRSYQKLLKGKCYNVGRRIATNG